MSENPYEQAKEFHQTFSPTENQVPTAYDAEKAFYRASFKVEELVEFLYAAANNQEQTFESMCENLKLSIDRAAEKIKLKNKKIADPLVDEVDALIDLLYFTYGSFVQMAVDPTEIFAIVHQANMGKLFPDGKPHYHPETGKVLKPANWEQECAPEEKIKELLKKQKK